MALQSSTVEQKIERIASRAWGVVTWAEMRAAGISADQIRARALKGLLLRMHPGVYRVGHRAHSPEAVFMAAVKACGAGSLLSGFAAAFLWGLVKGPVPIPEVTTRTERRVKGVKTRRSRIALGTTSRGIPVTTVPQTLVDLAAVLEVDALARACHKAGVRHRTTPRQVAEVLARYPNAPGAGRLRAVMSGEERVTLSELERRFLRLVREREAYARNDRFRRYGYRDVFEGPGAMLAELGALLIP